ncbi:hypothetical protein P3W85_34145 [Cupriavidus basilensis]|uniref:Uncharacterized protein n=1 Tax=Cupriavidus basilensis TaxID=68895 RepID=A0ABT6AZ92_9BURK|nr:hypothetical protein [Cupriavidus basilensis]MDF3837938.1 hypothetical protein [Cupriavidus basilensis]
MSIRRMWTYGITSAGLLSLLLLIATAQAKAPPNPCNPEKISIVDNQLIACSAEEFYETTITPPPRSALRLALDEEVRPQLVVVNPVAWPVRAILWKDPVLNGARWAEFDAQGNILQSNFTPAGRTLLEYRRQSTPVWNTLLDSRLQATPIWLGGGQHVYVAAPAKGPLPVDSFSPEDSLVIANGRVCPTRNVDTAYDYYRRLKDVSDYRSGNCEMAVLQRIGGGSFWVYPEDVGVRNESPNQHPLYWAAQYFSDPVTPLLDASGTCVLYCDAGHHATESPVPHQVHAIAERNPLDLRPPPKNALRAITWEEKEHENDDLKDKRPVNWPVRALFNSRSGIVQFDRLGNVIDIRGNATPIRAVETRFARTGKPFWQGGQQVYWLRNPDRPSNGDDASNSQTGIVIADGHACPMQLTAEAYGILHEDGRAFLNGNCPKAVKRAIGTREFWVYPEDETSAYPHYWVVQYFNDPITPIVDAEGQCWLYCDGRSQQGG